MCGIAVSFSEDGRAPRMDILKMRHRGPDGCGEWGSADGNVWMGHTRLAILDLSLAGNQPLHDNSNGNTIVFNGEIYNHLALRAEMAASGFVATWNSSCDTETVLKGYACWGSRIFEKLEGMFAVVIYDAAESVLVAARDRFGMKPLYYTRNDGTLLLSSETRLISDKISAGISPSGVSSYLRAGAFSERDSLFKNIYAIEPGHKVKFDAGIATVTPFWAFRKKPNDSCECLPDRFYRDGEEKVAFRVRELIQNSVQKHLLSDVPIAIFLSGGIDSTVITAMASKCGVEPKPSALSVVFQEKECDESKYASLVAKRYGLDHVRIMLAEDEVLALVKEAVFCMDVPSVDAINTFIVSKKAAEMKIKVALSGLGSDELFGGYPSFAELQKWKFFKMLPPFVRRRIGVFGATAARLSEMNAATPFEWAAWRRIFWTDAKLKSFGLPTRKVVQPVYYEHMDSFAQVSISEMTGYMRHLLLKDADQMAMAVSLEIRVPFLDNSLVDYVISIPQAIKTHYGKGKGLLLEACKDLIPPEIYSRPKQGFSLPMDAWMRGQLQEFVDEGWGLFKSYTPVKNAEADRYYQAFRKKELHWTRIWSCVVLGHYLKKNGSTPCASSD